MKFCLFQVSRSYRLVDFTRLWLNCPVHFCVSPNVDGITFTLSKAVLYGNEEKHLIALKGNYVFQIIETSSGDIQRSFPRLIENVYGNVMKRRIDSSIEPFPRGGFDAFSSALDMRIFYIYENGNCHVWRLHMSGGLSADTTMAGINSSGATYQG